MSYIEEILLKAWRLNINNKVISEASKIMEKNPNLDKSDAYEIAFKKINIK